MKMVWVIRYGEIGAKSESIRRLFLERLIRNIEDALKKERILYKSIKNLWSRIIIESPDERLREVLPRIFGIKSISPAYEIRASIESMKKAALKLLQRLSPETFKIDARRVTKDFPITSIEINKIVGEHVVKELGVRVDLKRPEVVVGIEVIRDRAYVYTEKMLGPGGLPLGVEGRVLAIVTEKSDLVAAWLMMKRGCEILPVIKGDPLVISPLRPFMYGNKYDCIVVKALESKTISKLIEEFKCLGICVGGYGKNVISLLSSFRDINVPVYMPDAFLPEEMYRKILNMLQTNAGSPCPLEQGGRRFHTTT